MFEIAPLEPLVTLFQTFKESEGVIDYVLISSSSAEDQTSYECHKAAAGLTIERIMHPRLVGTATWLVAAT